MSAQKNTSLKKATTDLIQVLNNSFNGNAECMQAIAHIEEIANSIEQKLNGSNMHNLAGDGEVISFAPEAVTSKI